VPVLGPPGERVITYFGEFGCLDGRIADTVLGGFLLDLELPKQRRDKFASQLTWIAKRQNDNEVVDAREQRRIIPKKPHYTLIFRDGTTMDCLVIDVSSSGVAVSADAEPEIGTPLAVGRSVGRVVRRFAEGFAVQFEHPQQVDDLELLISPPKGLRDYIAQCDALVASVAQPRGADETVLLD
jgi:hypothetical protein